VASADTIDNNITKLFESCDRGRVVPRINAELDALVAAVRSVRKAGRLTIKIDLTPADDDADQINVEVDVTGKHPHPSSPRTLFYADGRRLTRKDPNSPDLPGMVPPSAE